MEPAARQRFGRYETLFRVASGGMAEVYVARALGEGGFQKIVALKRIKPDLAQDARFVTMFLDEGRVAANIASPHVVSTLDLGRAEDNSLYLVMELVTGASLQTLVFDAAAKGPMPLAIAVDIVAQAALGLHHAHEATSPAGEPLDIVHRDCSPHNVLVDVKGLVKITDFGIAKALERQTESHAGEMKGKLAYLSPEQARGLPVDRRTDVFILGIVAWEAIAGRQLFVATNPVEAIFKVGNMPIPRLDTVRPEVGPDLADAIAQALERDPDARFATAGAFANALQHALGKPPARAQIGALVRERGGDSLTRLEDGIKRALAKRDGSFPPLAPAAAEPAPQPRAQSRLQRAIAPRLAPVDPPRFVTQPLGSDVVDAASAEDTSGEARGVGRVETAPLGSMTGGASAFEPAPLPLEKPKSIGVAWSESVGEAPPEEKPIPLEQRRPKKLLALRIPENLAFPEAERSLAAKVAIGLLVLGLVGGAVALAMWWSGEGRSATPEAPPSAAAPGE
jgi:serine/threonine protein kinase